MSYVGHRTISETKTHSLSCQECCLLWLTAESHSRNFLLKRNSLTQPQGWPLSHACCDRAALLPWFKPALKQHASSRDSPWIHWRGFCCNHCGWAYIFWPTLLMCIYAYQYFHPFSHLCSKVLYPIFLFPKESSTLTIPFLNSSNLIHSFHLKNILTLSFMTFQLSPYLIHCPHKFLQKVVYTLTPYGLIFSHLKMPTLGKWQVTFY